MPPTGAPGDRFRFYELDPAVVRIARDEDYFTYLADSRAEIEIVEGDGPIALANERARAEREPFDILVIDAFSSDAIPVHLLTREAMQLYVDSIAEDGLLAVHVTNQQLDLPPVVLRLGDDAGLHVTAIENLISPRLLSQGSNWAMLSPDPERIEEMEWTPSR